ncbi:MAG TPA: FAD-dependent oxidoreductase, partial [Ktedonobacterales bacterium]
MGSTSFWQAEADATAYPSLSGRVTADVAIIGAGITGTALALCLARAGLRPAVVEARAVASGASGRNGGFLLGGTSEAYAAARERYGIEMARRIWAFSVANHETLAGLIEEMHAGGWQTGYARTGSLRIASSEAEMAEIRESARLLAADGWAAEVLERESLPAPLRSTYLGASLHPGDGEVQPVRMVQGLARLAAASGARIYERSAAHAVAMGHDGVTVTTDGGAISAGSLVWATNAWLADDSLRTGFPWLAAAIHPTRGQMLATAPVTDRLFEMPCYANYGYQYWRQLPDGRLVVGGWRNLVPEVEIG